MGASIGQQIFRLRDRIRAGWYNSQMGSDASDYAGKGCARLYNRSWVAIVTAGLAHRRKEKDKAQQSMRKARELLKGAEKCMTGIGAPMKRFSSSFWREDVEVGVRSGVADTNVLLRGLVDELQSRS